MRRARSATADGPTPPRNVDEWLLALEELALELAVDESTRRYEKQVPRGLAPDATGTIRCLLQGTDPRPCEVVLAPEGRRLEATCSCPFARGYCKHIAALVAVLLERLDAGQTEGFDAPHDASSAALARIEQALARLDAAEPVTRKSEGKLWWRLALGPGVALTPVLEESGQRNALTLGAFEFRCGLSLEATPEDARLAALLKTLSAGTYGRRPDLGPIALLDLLAGHPRIALVGDSEPATLGRGTAGLAVVETPEPGAPRYRLAPAIDGHPVSPAKGLAGIASEGVVTFSPETRRIVVAPAPPALASLFETLAAQTASLPLGAMSLLVERIERRHPGIALALPQAFRRRAVEPAPQLVLALTPSDGHGDGEDRGGGASLALRARPIPGGPSVLPGRGERRLAASVAGERLETTRDLAAEKDRADALTKTLGLPFASTESEAWLEDEDLLDLLGRFQRLFGDKPEVCVLEWPLDALPRSVVAFSPRDLRVEVRARQDWFGLEGGVELGDDTVSLATILGALREGRRYVPLGKGRYAALEQLVEGRLADLALLARAGKGGSVEIPRASVALASEVLAALPVAKPPVSWTQLLGAAREAATLSPDPPAGFEAELRPYQLEGYRWLARLAALGVGGCLADDMGLGKTVQAAAALLARRDEGPALVVAPTSVGFNWERELARFTPGLRVLPYRTKGRAVHLEEAKAGDVVVTSYGLLRRDAAALAKVAWGSLVLDEAQAVKNGASQTAKAARSIPARWTIALTGTPVENHLGELWSLFSVIAPGILGSFEQFATRFARPIEGQKDPERRQALARVVRPFLLRRTKGEVLKELPPRSEVRLDVELSKAERTLYEQARLEAIAELTAPKGEGDPRFRVLAALTKLRQLACHARLVDPHAPAVSSKLEVLLEQLDTLREEGHRALVFSQFVRHLELVRDALAKKGVETVWLDGSTPARERERLVDQFQQGTAPVFLISLKAGGTGLNLTGADYVFLLDPWWNPAVEDQAADRAHRIGQTRPVTVVRIVALETIEEKVLALHAAKRDLVAGVLDGTGSAGALSTQELLELLREGAQSSGQRPRESDAARSAHTNPPARSNRLVVSEAPEAPARKSATAETLARKSAVPADHGASWKRVTGRLANEWGQSLAPSSARAYLGALRPTLAALAASPLAPKEAFLAHLEAVGREPGVLHAIRMSALRSFIAFLGREGLLSAEDETLARDRLAAARDRQQGRG